MAVDQVDAEAAEDRGAHPRGVVHAEEGGDARAHRITHDVGALDAKMVEQRAHVVSHQRHLVVGRIVKLAGGAVAAIVERYGAAAGAGECSHPARIDPVHFFGGGKAMDQDDGLGIGIFWAFVEISDLDRVMLKIWHRCDPSS